MKELKKILIGKEEIVQLLKREYKLEGEIVSIYYSISADELQIEVK